MVQSIRPLMIIPERSLVLRKYVSFWVIILFIILTAGCTITHEFGPFMGKVVDAESGEPVKGAVEERPGRPMVPITLALSIPLSMLSKSESNDL
jgi:hypothetical protein